VKRILISYKTFLLKALAKKDELILCTASLFLNIESQVTSEPLFFLNFSPYRAVNTLLSYKKTNQLMLCREIIAVCSEIHTKQIKASSWQETEFFYVQVV
jgi:hypothetical protein